MYDRLLRTREEERVINIWTMNIRFGIVLYWWNRVKRICYYLQKMQLSAYAMTGVVSSPALFDRICSLQWRHNGRDGVSNYQDHDSLLHHLFGCRSKKTSQLRITGLCARNSPGTGEFPAQMASNAEKFFIWWRHHVMFTLQQCSECKRISYRCMSTASCLDTQYVAAYMENMWVATYMPF